MRGYASFSTAVGRCALAWSGEAIVGAALPGSDEAATIRAVTGNDPDAAEAVPPDWVQDVISRIQRLFEGTPVSFSDVPLDLDCAAPFERSVYAQTRAIPHGETLTYGALAAAVGQPGAARAVGCALGRNPIPIIVPCHRVLAADGRSGGFSAPGGVSTKLRLLAIERARTDDQPMLFEPVWAASPARR